MPARLAGLAVVLATLLLAVATPAAPAATLATIPDATVVGAAGGWTAWSERDGSRFVLVTRAPDGTVARPAVAPRRVPFDLDLGVSATGRVVAAYSRCAVEPPRTTRGLDERPPWRFGRGCRIHVLDLATGRELALRRGPGTTSNVVPSIAGDTLAYVSVRSAARSVGVARVRSLRTGRDRKLHDGPNRYFSVAQNRTGTGRWESPASVDTDGRRVTVAWISNTTDSTGTVYYTSHVRVQSLRARRPTVEARADSGGSEEQTCIAQVLSPTLTPRGLTFLRRTAEGWYVNRLEGRVFAFGPSSNPPRGRQDLLSAAVDGDRLVVAERFADPEATAIAPVQVNEYPLGTFTGDRPRQAGCV